MIVEKIGLKKRGKTWSKFGLSIITILILIDIGIFYLDNYVDYDKDRLETIDIGNEIIKALENYYIENNRYPESLERLVPKYLGEVKPPKWGEDGWIYEFADPNAFMIMVGYREWSESYYPVMIYSSLRKEAGWIYDN